MRMMQVLTKAERRLFYAGGKGAWILLEERAECKWNCWNVGNKWKSRDNLQSMWSVETIWELEKRADLERWRSRSRVWPKLTTEVKEKPVSRRSNLQCPQLFTKPSSYRQNRSGASSLRDWLLSKNQRYTQRVKPILLAIWQSSIHRHVRRSHIGPNLYIPCSNFRSWTMLWPGPRSDNHISEQVSYQSLESWLALKKQPRMIKFISWWLKS
jgi:hypothetical protein